MKIKICHIADHLTGKADGIFTQLQIQFSYIDDTRFENHLVIPAEIDNISILQSTNVKIKILPSLSSKIPLFAFAQMLYYIKKNRINVLHVHFLKPYVLVGVANIFLRKSAVYNYHGLSFENIFNSRLEIIIYKLFNKLINLVKSYNLVLAPSEKSKQRLIEEGDFKIPIESYYLGTDSRMLTEVFDPELKLLFERIKKDNFIIGMVARVDISKRIDRAVKVFSNLLEENGNIVLVIMGDGDQIERVKELVQEMRLNEKIYILGYVKNARNYMKYFDMFLLTSDWEGFPIVVWEAMASGVPIISTDVGGIKEIIEKENCGYTFQTNDLVAAQNIIHDLIQNKLERDRLGNNGYIAFRKSYQSNRFIERIELLYEKIVKK